MNLAAALVILLGLFSLAGAVRHGCTQLAKALRAASKPRRAALPPISELRSPISDLFRPVPVATNWVVDAAKATVPCPVCAAGRLLATEVGTAAAVHCTACHRTTGFRATLKGAIALGLAGKLEESK